MAFQGWSSQAWSKATDSRSVRVGVHRFESGLQHSSSHICSATYLFQTSSCMISVKYLSGNPSVMKEGQATEVRAALVGACGRMGSLIIRRILETEGITLSAAFDIVNISKDVGEVIGIGKLDVPVSDSKDLASVLKASRTDVLIDFTIAPATAANAPIAAAAGVNMIIGTTGLTAEQRTDITESVIKNKIAAVISSNYSIGVGVFFKLVREAAKYLGNDYDVEIIEAHHNQKKDAPSGTALTTAEVISEAMGGKDLVYGREGICPRGKEIGIHAVRGGDIVGDHTVMFIGNSERIELRHQAHTREIFVGGAVMAAKWVAKQKKGVVYAMSDVLDK